MSFVAEVLDALVEQHGAGAPEALEAMLGEMSVLELAALEADWRAWARPKQLPPSRPWRSWGFLTGRGFGKTLAVARHIHEEVDAGRAGLILLLAQDEQSAIDLQIQGPSGLIATAPPMRAPTWLAESRQLVWPNGARAYVRTPEVPGKIRGLEYELGWCSEIQSWPAATREEAWSNVLLSVRRGYARVVWDATPKRGHPILRELVERASAGGGHHIVRGTTYENALNLGDGYIEALEARYAGTTQGREELGGEMLDDEEGATVAQVVIDQHRVSQAPRLARRIVSVDPATRGRKGSDTTGIVELGLGLDGRGYVLADHTARREASEWGALVVDLYLAGRCDCVVVETNQGGDLLAQNLRAETGASGVSVVVLPKGSPVPQHNARIIYVREVWGRGEKSERARPVGTAYERGRVSHVGRLPRLEDTLTGWVPGPHASSPGDLDALVHGLTELLSLAEARPDPKASMAGIVEAQRQIMRPSAQRVVVGVGGWGGETI